MVHFEAWSPGGGFGCPELVRPSESTVLTGYRTIIQRGAELALLHSASPSYSSEECVPRFPLTAPKLEIWRLEARRSSEISRLDIKVGLLTGDDHGSGCPDWPDPQSRRYSQGTGKLSGDGERKPFCTGTLQAISEGVALPDFRFRVPKSRSGSSKPVARVESPGSRPRWNYRRRPGRDSASSRIFHSFGPFSELPRS